MLTVSAFAEELIILKQCQWLKKFNLNLILTCNIFPPSPSKKKKENPHPPIFWYCTTYSPILRVSLAQVGCKYIIAIIAGADELYTG